MTFSAVDVLMQLIKHFMNGTDKCDIFPEQAKYVRTKYTKM